MTKLLRLGAIISTYVAEQADVITHGCLWLRRPGLWRLRQRLDSFTAIGPAAVAIMEPFVQFKLELPGYCCCDTSCSVSSCLARVKVNRDHVTACQHIHSSSPYFRERESDFVRLDRCFEPLRWLRDRFKAFSSFLTFCDSLLIFPLAFAA